MTFKIEYPTGCMELDIEGFFPCKQQKAKIVFGLVNEWCSREQRHFLYVHLISKVLYPKNKIMYRRALMNIQWLEKGGDAR